MKLHFSLLGGKSCFPDHTGTQSSMLPSATQLAILHPTMPRKPAPLHKQDPGFPLLHKEQKAQVSSLGSLMLAAAVSPTSLCLVSRPQSTCFPKTLFSHDCSSCRDPRTSRPQGLCCLADTERFKPTHFNISWALSTCYSVAGSLDHTCK
jgi:hypothetical protein